MKRVPEPELMENKENVQAYAQADFSTSNQLFVDSLLKDFPDINYAIDIGCGPADVLLRLARAKPSVRILGIDGSEGMVEAARRKVAAEGMEKQILLMKGYLPGIVLEDKGFEAVLSKDLLHHLQDPSVLWQEIKQIAKPGTVVYVVDLERPKTISEAKRIVRANSAGESDVLSRDFYNSLRAAYTQAELEGQLKKAKLDSNLKISRLGERHLLIKGRL